MHIPVLKEEALRELNLRKNKNFIDATFGEGGHAKEILKTIKPEGKLLAIERDNVLYQRGLKMNLTELILYNDSYSNLQQIVIDSGLKEIAGILFDLGFCTFHVKESQRGFSFRENEPLDMRYNREGETAEEIVNTWPKEKLEEILKEYGQERYARKIALQIIKERKEKRIETTLHLVEIIRKSFNRRSKIHFATRTFQALRIAVNDELNNLKKGLEQAYNVLDEKGKIVVISFHSLEDKIVKEFFKEKNMQSIIITPSEEEIKNNKQSRSAKLRVATKI